MKSQKKYSPEHIALSKLVHNRAINAVDRKRRSQVVFNHLLGSSNCIDSANFQTIGSEDLGSLFHAIDELFFDGLVGKLSERVAARPLSFRLSTRMTSTGGMTTMQRATGFLTERYRFEIAIATTPLFESFRGGQVTKVGGIKCVNRFEALQRIMEHEVVHLIEMLLTNDSNCSAAPFKKIVRNFFGHTESNHCLLTPSDSAKERLGISPGDHVRFTCNGIQRQGILQRVTKRATVLVLDSAGHIYDDGRRYAKYYVPIRHLKRT